jgi:hypothetical protein
MVDHEGRRELQRRLAQLICGEISNDAFFLTRFGSTDVSLREIWKFGNALMHDFYPAYMRGANKLSPEREEIARRCLLFLSSELEYEWPALSESSWCYWAFVSGCLSSALGIIAASFQLRLLSILLVLIGAIACACSFAYQRRAHRKQLQAFEQTGNKNLWPFFRQSDYDHYKGSDVP